MARLSRITQKIFASSASNNGVFGSGQDGTKVLSNDLPTIMSKAAWLTGWLSAVLGASKFPPLEEFQSVSYVHSTQIAYLLQQGIAEYDSGTTYFTNNICVKAGTFQVYGSLTDNNLGNALTSAANWKLLVDLSAIGAGNPIYAGGTSTGTANAQVLGTVSPSGYSLTNGYTVVCTAGFTNTGATTFNIASTGVIAVKKNSGAGLVPLTGSEIGAGNTIYLTYNAASNCHVLGNSPGLLASNNLSDVQSAATSRTNLGAAASGANTDITSLAAPALGAATSTTPAAFDATTKVVNGTGLAVALNSSLWVCEEQPSGTNPQSLSTSWPTRILNTVKSNTITGASVSANQVTLPAGTYEFDITSPCIVQNGAEGKARLYNVTDSAAIAYGQGLYESSGDGGNTCVNSTIKGVFTIAGTKTLAVQHYSAHSYLGGCPSSIASVVEVYANAFFKRVA